jgi:Fic family protein
MEINMNSEHQKLRLIEPLFSSTLTDLIIELDFLRKKRVGGTTHPQVFSQLKQIFHMLESIGSARIEGNNTTIAEYIETKIDGAEEIPDTIQEIQNMEKALEYIDSAGENFIVNRDFVCGLHKKAVGNLPSPPNGEGDDTPGFYRTGNVAIKGAQLIPPKADDVQWYMDELFDFVNKPEKPKYDLLKVATAHHRFVWIHPFSNGNGRTVRLFTYALLVKSGFAIHEERILNPTAVFCSNRRNYYHQLSLADTGTDDGLFSWCEYVLTGLKKEMEKIDRLSDYSFLKTKILIPSILQSLERKVITEVESKILLRAAEEQVLKASHLTAIFKGKLPQEISRNIARLKEKKMLVPEKDGTRRYILRFDNNYLLRAIIRSLSLNRFLPENE